jgi:23S rRNA (guanine745-N1)-methyltransferase
MDAMHHDGRVHPAVLARLSCPVCAAPLHPTEAALRCPAGHSFDRAHHGYVDLAGPHVTHPGDTAQMVAARVALLAAGHFDPLADALVAAAERYAPARAYHDGLVVDVGAGTGYYLAALLEHRPSDHGLALDVSKPALRRAAAAHPRAAAARADAWRHLPVAYGVATVALNVFAPRSGAELRRILRPDGVLLVVTPAAGHLAELVGAAGLLRVDPAKEQRLAAALGHWFTQAGEESVCWTLRLSREAAAAAVRMGPSAWHTDPRAVDAALAELPEPVPVSAAVRISAWRPRPAEPA